MPTLKIIALIAASATLVACSSFGRERIHYEHTFKIQFDPRLHDGIE